MSKRRFRRPSPAMVVACIGLAVALSGASYAAVVLPRNSVGTPQLKKNAVNSAKVKDRSLKARDFALGQLPGGPAGPQGPAGTARAYAIVRYAVGAPVFVADRTFNFTTVTRSSQGIYCLELSSGISSATIPAVVSVDYLGTSSPQGNTTAMPNTVCGTNGISVRTYRRATGAATDDALANNVAFTIIVP